MKIQIKKNLIYWFAGLSTLLLSIIILSFINIYKQNDNANSVISSYKLINNLKSILSVMIDIETGGRGFIITNNERFLEPFNSGIKKIDSLLIDVIYLNNHKGERKKKLTELYSLVELKIKFTEELIEDKKQDKTELVIKKVESGVGKELMDNIRKIISDIQKEENKMLELSSNDVFKNNFLTKILISVGGVFGLALILFAYVMIKTELRAREKVEDELRQSELTLRSFFDNTGLMMGIVELYKNEIFIISVNKHTASFVNKTTAEISKMNVSEFNLPTNYFNAWLNYYKECERTQKPVQFELLRDFGDRPRYFSNVVSFIEKMSNGHSRFSFVITDITDRKIAEEKLKKNEKLLDTIIENMPVGLWIADKTGKIIRGNKAGIKIWAGAKYVDILQFAEYKGWWVKNGIKIEAEEWALARAIRKGETSIDEEIFIECFDNSCKTILNSAMPIYNDESEIETAIIINQDITKLKNAELQLRESERTLKSFFDNAGMLMGIVLVNENDIEFVKINKATEELLFKNRIDKSVIKLNDLGIDKDYINEWRNYYKKAEETLTAQNFDFFSGPALSNKWYSITVSFIDKRENGNSIFAFIVEDRTVQKKLEKELEFNLSKLQISNSELLQFAYAASHDLQSPLRSISGFANLLKQTNYKHLDEAGKEYINLIINSSSKMQKLIRDLLNYSRVGKTENLQNVNCVEIIDGILVILSKYLEENNAVVTYNKLPKIYADKIKIIQLFQNLIENGIKYNKSGNPLINIYSEKINGYWKFTFSDNGIGIDKKHFERIFMVFQRLHLQGEYEGTGIGLALCKKIVESYGGKIWIESQVDIGSTFYFTIPDREELKLN